MDPDAAAGKPKIDKMPDLTVQKVERQTLNLP
jgi:hypothetical protein